MTSYRRINSRTINRDVQQQDNMVFFNKPLSRAIYPNYFSVPDASNTSLLVSTSSPYSATATRDLLYDGTTFDVLANMVVDGTTSLQDVNVFGNLDVSGNTDISGNLAIAGNVTANGTILARQFLPGQVANMAMLNYTELSQTTITIQADISNNLFSFLYTPKIANSSLLLEYQTNYTFGGGGNDDIEAYLFVTDTADRQIARTFQHYEDAQGGGTRSGTILPIVGRYDNSNLTGKTIRVKIWNNTDADPITVSADNSTWLKITEIAR